MNAGFLTNTHMKYIITQTLTVQHVVEAPSATDAITKANEDFRELYLEGDAPGKGIVIGGSYEPTTVHTINNGKLELIGHDANGEFVPTAIDLN